MDPEDYPAQCTIDASELEAVREAITDPENDDWRCYTEEWPPTDEKGRVFPIWFTVDELTERGELLDRNNNNYNPFTGNLEPTLHRTDGYCYCNTPVVSWEHRYPSIRYCSVVTEKDVDNGYCHFHRGRINVNSAEEYLQTGLHSQSLDHVYGKLSPWKKLLGHGLYESLMGESSYDFAPEYKPKTFDFSEEDVMPDDCEDNGQLTVKCAYPTEYVDPALSLFQAAMLRVQMMMVQPRIMYEDRDNGEGMMESKTIEKAQLTAPPSEHDPSPQQFETLESWSEHHLNLPFSRLFNDMEKALERGGVSIDPDSDETEEIDTEGIVLNIEAEADGVSTIDSNGTDPNEFDGLESESQKIVDNIENDG